MPGQGVGQTNAEVRLQQMVGADVHADLHVQSAARPGFNLFQRSLNDPLTENLLKRTALQVWQEFTGRQQATLGVLPANQCFRADHLTTVDVDLGLVKQQKLVPTERLLHVLKNFQMALHLAVDLGIEQLVAVLASLFRQVHGLVGMAQQGVRINLVVRVQADPDAGCDAQEMAIRRHRAAHGEQHTVKNLRAFRQRTHVGKQQDELVPGKS